ncbi:MAG: antibiotic biosynthesis monooxygenase, partial [Deltaproteobacteria bacterium]|nr:antibiotic biosynthesis monooxygenase [Deltaproteobacteria bacterium]
MPVKVIIKRKIQINNPEELLPLIATLRSKAKEQPGYIDGSTWRSMDNPDDYMVISTWETHEDWTNW